MVPEIPVQDVVQSGSLRAVLLAGVFWVGLAVLCWLGMQIVHESGHILAAWATGGSVSAVDLHPLHISRTDVRPNPWPRLVIWSGPLWGSLLPVLMWLLARRYWPSQAAIWQFFAGFCLIANGAYLGSTFATPVGDAAHLVQLGEPRWTLALFAAVVTPLGIWLWDGIAPRLGIGPKARPVTIKQTLAVWSLLAVIVVVELTTASV